MSLIILIEEVNDISQGHIKCWPYHKFFSLVSSVSADTTIISRLLVVRGGWVEGASPTTVYYSYLNLSDALRIHHSHQGTITITV